LALGCRAETAPASANAEPATSPTDPAPVEVKRSLPAHDPEDASTAVGVHGAVASAEAHASEIGLEVLRAGGNAIDAAVAVGFALGVTHPSAGNIGGGGFMVVRLADGSSFAVDYREMAPGAAHRDMYLDPKGDPTKESRVGPRAAGVPGVVAGFALAHERWGTKPWKELVDPAVGLARDGWSLDEWHAKDLEYGSKRMADAGYPESAAVFRKQDGSTFAPGDRWAQPDLGATLAAIAEGGAAAFYGGELAGRMAEGVQAAGGLWTVEDLAGYRAIERQPLVFDYRGHEIVAMPPPSAGGVVLRQILAAQEVMDTKQHPWHSAMQIHLYLETLRRTYADRNLLLGDPDFVSVPMEKLLDVSYIGDRVADIDPEKATPSDQVGAGVELKESEQTTHFSIVDDAGNAVSNTFTLNGGFGAKMVIPGTGVILNNEMDDFTAKPGTPNMFGLVQGPQNAIAPGKRMLSSMTPTIVSKDGKLRAVLGSPGGPTITTTVAQILTQLVDYGHDLTRAVAEPRLHHQWKPDKVRFEGGLDESVQQSLEGRGHVFHESNWRIGHANCIEVDPETRGYRAVADIERDGGKAVAY
jgi:gamma-glutamyltranspeptidase/glutathione hydrolase